MVKISIIVPVYNVERYIKRCLDSLVNQTMTDIEILIINDETPDNSMEICKEFAKVDSRVKIFSKKNEGLGLTRNYGIERAKGEYICFVDSDDYVTNDMCEVLYNAAKQHRADIVYGGIYRDNNKGKIIKKPCVDAIKVWNSKEEVKDLLLDFIGTEPNNKNDTIMEVSVWKALFKHSVFTENNIRFVSEREFISEDVIFDIDFFLKSRCVVAIPECVYYYCVNQNSLSKVFRADRFKKEKILYEEVLKKMQNKVDKETLNLRTDRFLIARARTNAKKIIKHRKIIGKEKTEIALKEIIEDKDLKNILARYPIKKLPKKYALVAYIMKWKFIRILKLVLR